MVSAKGTMEITGVVLIVAGAILGLYGLIATSYSPLTAPLGFNVYVFWGGIIALVAGVAIGLYGVYGMRYPREERKEVLKPITA